MHAPLLPVVMAFLDARLHDEAAAPTARYVSRAEAFKDVEAKVRIMNRAHAALEFAQAFPGDTSAVATLVAYEEVIRHLAEVYDAHAEYQHRWRPEEEDGP